MATNVRWANIVCDKEMTPFLLIVTDGDRTTEIPVDHTKLKVVKKTAMDIYSVRPGHILVTQILGDKNEYGKE